MCERETADCYRYQLCLEPQFTIANSYGAVTEQILALHKTDGSADEKGHKQKKKRDNLRHIHLIIKGPELKENRGFRGLDYSTGRRMLK